MGAMGRTPWSTDIFITTEGTAPLEDAFDLLRVVKIVSYYILEVNLADNGL